MDESRDFMQWLGQDMSLKILMSLEDPSDLVRISAVSISWHQFGEFNCCFCLFSSFYCVFLLIFSKGEGKFNYI